MVAKRYVTNSKNAMTEKNNYCIIMKYNSQMSYTMRMFYVWIRFWSARFGKNPHPPDHHQEVELYLLLMSHKKSI